MAQTTQVHVETLTILACADCHMLFGITKSFEQDRRDDHTNFYCPKGHPNHWPQQSDEERFRKEKAVLERKLDNALAREDREKAHRQAVERTNRALKGHLTRWKRRVSNGVCPVASCKRHFPNVQNHVKTCHADWLKEHPEVFDE